MNNYVNGQTAENIKDSAKKNASNFSSDVQKSAKSGASKIEDAAYDVQTVMADRFAEISENARVAREMAEKYVKSNPATAILGAAAIGLLAGAVLTVAFRPSRD